MDVGGLLFSDRPGEVDGVCGIDGQGGAARGCRGAPAGKALRIGEALAPIRRTAEPKSSFVFRPRGIESAPRAHGEVQAPVVPTAPREASFAVAGDGVREVDRIAEGLPPSV